MKCPFCGSKSDKVVDSRSTRDGLAVRRRRECLECGRRYTTYEYIEEGQIFVTKKNGRREPFDKDKIIGGVTIACRKRPVTVEQIESIASEIEKELSERVFLDVNSEEIGKMVMERLKKIDQVAYVRFASVYRQFKDVSEFQEALKKLLGESENSS